VKLIPSIPQETDDVTSDFDNIVANAKDYGILFILLLGMMYAAHAVRFTPDWHVRTELKRKLCDKLKKGPVTLGNC